LSARPTQSQESGSGSVVTLRGPIDSSEERTLIVNAAQGMSGVTRVDDQLELVTPEGS